MMLHKSQSAAPLRRARTLPDNLPPVRFNQPYQNTANTPKLSNSPRTASVIKSDSGLAEFSPAVNAKAYVPEPEKDVGCHDQRAAPETAASSPISQSVGFGDRPVVIELWPCVPWCMRHCFVTEPYRTLLNLLLCVH